MNDKLEFMYTFSLHSLQFIVQHHKKSSFWAYDQLV